MYGGDVLAVITAVLLIAVLGGCFQRWCHFSGRPVWPWEPFYCCFMV